MTLAEVKKEYIVYMHKNKINNKIYIGITYQNTKNRWRKNGLGYKKQKQFYNAICKYGWDNFEHIILFENLTKDEACQKEQELIKKYKSNDRNYGYNLSEGGESGSKGSHWIMSKETKRKMSEKLKGHISWNKGMKYTKEQKNKISIATKKAMQNPEIKNKLHKKKTINKNTWKKVVCVETNEIFESIIEASKNKKCKDSDISKVCKGKRKTCGGYHWRYYEE